MVMRFGIFAIGPHDSLFVAKRVTNKFFLTSTQ